MKEIQFVLFFSFTKRASVMKTLASSGMNTEKCIALHKDILNCYERSENRRFYLVIGSLLLHIYQSFRQYIPPCNPELQLIPEMEKLFQLEMGFSTSGIQTTIVSVPSFPFFLPSPFLTCCAILPTSFGGKRPHLRR